MRAHVAERVVYRAEHASARLLRKVLGRHTAKVGRPVRAAVAPLRRRRDAPGTPHETGSPLSSMAALTDDRRGPR